MPATADRFLRRSRYGQSSETITDEAGRPIAWCHTYTSESNHLNPRAHRVLVGPALKPRPVVGTVGYLVI